MGDADLKAQDEFLLVNREGSQGFSAFWALHSTFCLICEDPSFLQNQYLNLLYHKAGEIELIC
jgi:hypothetical protein